MPSQPSTAGVSSHSVCVAPREATSFMRTSHRRDVEAIGRGSSGAGSVPFL